MARKKKRSEAATVAARVEEVLRIRLDGAQFHDVQAYAAEKGWDVRERQLRTYIRRADDMLAERTERSRKRIIAVHLARREALYARCVNAASYRDALACLTDLAKLQGLYPDGRELKELVKLATEQATRLRELEARLDATRTESPAEAERPDAGPAGREAPDHGAAASDVQG